MAKNKLEDLTDHLFCQAERLNNDELQGEDLKDEILKANALCNISEQIINTGKLAIEGAKTAHSIENVIKHPLLENISKEASEIRA